MSANDLRPGTRLELGRELHRQGPPPNGVRYLPGARKAVVHGLTGFVLWYLDAGRIEKALPLPQDCGMTSTWTTVPHAHRLVVGADDGTIRVLDLAGDEIIGCSLPHDAERFLRDEAPGLSGSTSRTKTDGTPADGSGLYSPYTRPCSLSAAAGPPWILAAYGQAYAILWDLDTGELRHLIGSWSGHDDLDRIYRVALSPDGRFAATVHIGSGLHVWETTDAKHMFHLPLQGPRGAGRHSPRNAPLPATGLDGIGPVVFTPGSRTVAVASQTDKPWWSCAGSGKRSMKASIVAAAAVVQDRARKRVAAGRAGE